jgi:hypothetical protein
MNTSIQNKKNQKNYHYIYLILSLILMIGSLFLKIRIPQKIEEYYTKQLTSLIPTEIQIPFSTIIDYLDSINPIIILGIIMFNIQNAYKSFILFNMPCIMCYLISFFQILLKSPLRKAFRGVLKEYGFSFPNYYINMVVTFYFSLWYIFFYSYKNYHCLSKYISLFSLNIFFIFIMFGHVVSGMHYIFEIILSVFFSYGFCIFILIGLNLKLDNSEELCNIINFNISFYILIYLCSFFLLLFIYFIRKNEEDNILLNKSLIISSYFYGGLFSIFGIKSEINFIFEGQIKYWKQCNFEKYEKDDINKISIIKDKMWYSTNIKKIVFRIIYFIICSLSFIIPFYLYIKNTENIILNYLIYWLESAFVMYGIFFLFKSIIIKKECLVNNLFFEGFEETPLLYN